MRNIVSRVVVALLVVVGALAASAQFTYVSTNHTITITGYTGPGGAVDIPGEIEGWPVTRIGESAFFFSGLTSVTLPDTVVEIGDDAFEGSGGLTNVTLGSNVVSIGAWAFSGCTSLTNLALPGRVATIGHWAFSYCSRLNDILLPGSVTNLGAGVFSSCSQLMAIRVEPDNACFGSAAGVLFNKGQTALIQFPPGAGGSYEIPAGVVSIGMSAFAGARGLTNLVIPDSVNDIAYGAFANCRGLSGVIIPGAVTNIDRAAFSYCTGLTNVVIPDSVVHVGPGPFPVCTNLTAIVVGSNNPAYTSLDGVLFDKNRTLLIQYPGGRAGSYTIPAGVAALGSSAFHGSRRLTSVSIPETVTNLSDWTFTSCTALTGVAIPNGVTAIEEWDFDGCGSLAWVRFGTNLARIDSLAFVDCVSLTNLTFPASVGTIGYRAFSDCTNLAGLFFQGAPPTVDDGAFDTGGATIAYYLPGATGWGPALGDLSTALWNPRVLTGDATFGLHGGRFGFTIAGTADIPIVVEASPGVRGAAWQALQSCTLTNGQLYYSDPDWTPHPARFYRLRSP